MQEGDANRPGSGNPDVGGYETPSGSGHKNAETALDLLTKTQEARKRDFQGGEAASRDTLFLVQLDVGRIHSWLLAALLKVLLQAAAERASALNRSSQVERSARMTTTAQ